ncbi:DUF1501 domain-containing protein [bacterium]|nr:DUF1501 domain-containing protein [bacterium]
MTLHYNCERVGRRDCLKLGLSAATGLGFTDLLRLRSFAVEAAAANVTGRKMPSAIARPKAMAAQPTSCVLVWLDGGPTHYETFDPKPTAPKEIRGEFDPIATKTPGIFYSQEMKKLASISDKIAIVRSICHNQGNHGAGNHYMMTGAPTRIPVGCGAFVSFHPSLGSTVAYMRREELGALPGYFSMPSMSRSGGPNFLGAKYAPFVVGDDPNREKFRVRDVALPSGLTEGRFESRRSLRSDLDTLARFADPSAGDPVVAQDSYVQQGYDLVTSPQAQRAFDISLESDRVRDRYGRNAFGQRALLARRLVEAGVPFITLYEGGWDHHTNLFPSLKKRLPGFDQTVATLIQDLDERGLLDTTLVIVLGEFGRTPQINKDGGRDHWSNAMSVLFAGCGTPGGQVVGATDPRGYSAVDRVLAPENFASTVYRKLGIDPDHILYTPQGRPAHLVSDPTPIQELMG